MASTVDQNATLERPPLLALYEQMLRIRRFEEHTQELFNSGEVVGTAHSAIGQEAVAVGAGAVLRPDDYIVGHHRSHGHLVARGADVYRMVAELLGRETGYCKGLGGSMHIADVSLGILGCNGIVGAGLPIGVGAALSARVRGTDQVVVVFFGDGAAGQGLAHEAMNLAAVWKLPVVFVCENNGFQLSAEWEEIRPLEDVAARAASYDMPSAIADGNDVQAMLDAMGEAVAHTRATGRPYLLEAKTFRLQQHSMRANLPELRSEDVVRSWWERDPLVRLERQLSDADRAQLDAIRERVEAEFQDALDAARGDAVLAEDQLDAIVYAPAPELPAEPGPGGGRTLGYLGAVNEAMAQEMDADESVVVIGEDVARLGGIFQATKGLHERFGAARVRNTPISEGGFTGAAVGAAMTGLRPIVEIQIFDFVTMAMDAIVNQAAKMRFMTGGQTTIPMVVRGPGGGGVRLAAQHSQSLEAWFAHIPGLKVVVPSGPYDAKGLLAAAIRDDNPVIFIESKSLLFSEEEVPEERYAIELGTAAIKRAGTDVTIIATQGMVTQALRAAGRLSRDGIEAEVIDPRTIYPLDLETIVASVARTNRVVVAHEAVGFCGFGAEVAALVSEHAFDELDAPVLRVSAPHRPMPYQKDLERATMPEADAIVDAVRRLG
ncbi:dehydrogenase [Baekduia soli]|uniref:dihydrolipoyllysine-residue succinyltransferase n=1 Tax=Baekduia soli TaxID=496014 RepID=A0A5B8U0M0_9ACTN|nr:dehydrogenase E1 component subunit alpha/beta [Baekduia soli]QEC46531.1 dehydrogenase [Baekduia soli]